MPAGYAPAHAYTIEFQKRGLPHAHILIILTPDDRFKSIVEVDAAVSAEIPDQALYPNLYATVTSCMLHGNCSHYATTKTGKPPPCWDPERDECKKQFPKAFNDETVFEPDFGYPKYRRRRPTGTPEDDSKQNCWVVPYNPYLTAKYDAHINVEICANVKACKYIFKYVHKGSDRASLRIQRDNGADGVDQDPVDEVEEYREARWVGSAEACWRIYTFEMHANKPAVERLDLHLPNAQGVQFDDEDDLALVLGEEAERETKLTAFFKLNQLRRDQAVVGDLLYTDVTNDHVWKKDLSPKQWQTRQRDTGTISRMHYINPTAGELFYLRYLLLHVPNPTSFEDLLTVNDTVNPTFHAACTARGLLLHDSMPDDTLRECSAWHGGHLLRGLFVYLLLNSDIDNALNLWNGHKTRYVDRFSLVD